MPYINKDARIALKESLKNVATLTELNYVITCVILAAWNVQPAYDTMHMLHKQFIVEPKRSKFLNHLRDLFADRFSVADIYTVAQEAFYEFRDRVGKIFHAKQCLANGDLEEYENCILPLMDELMSLKKEKGQTKTSLILPGGSK